MNVAISVLWIISIYAIFKALKKKDSPLSVSVGPTIIRMNNAEKVEMDGDTGRELWEKTNSFLNGEFRR